MSRQTIRYAYLLNLHLIFILRMYSTALILLEGTSVIWSSKNPYRYQAQVEAGLELQKKVILLILTAFPTLTTIRFKV